MNIGGDILRRYGPRRALASDAGALGDAPEQLLPGPWHWIGAAAALIVGALGIIGLSVAGFRSKDAAQHALLINLTVIGAYVLWSVSRYLAKPLHDPVPTHRGYPMTVVVLLLVAATLAASGILCSRWNMLPYRASSQLLLIVLKIGLFWRNRSIAG